MCGGEVLSGVDFDDILLDVDEELFAEKKLPLVTTPSMAKSVATTFTKEPVDIRESVELVKDADRLFDFTDTTLTPVQQMYIIGYAVRGTKKGACQLAGVTYSVVSRWLKNDEFTGALQDAVELVKDSLEEELIRRAMNGSDRLLIEAIKAANPEKYQPKTQNDININGQVVHSWADLAKQAAEIKAADVIEIEGEVIKDE